MFLLDQPEMEPTLSDERIILRAPPPIDPAPVHRMGGTHRWQVAKVIVGFVSVTLTFQMVLGRLLSWWLDI